MPLIDTPDTQQWPNSLWRETAMPLEPSPTLDEDIDCDVVIVGAGFTGLRAALHLGGGGLKVVVLDAADVGWGASGRNGGQVNPMLPFNSPDQVRKLVGPRYFERLTEVSLQSADALFELIREHGIDCDARQKGWLRVDHCARARRMSAANAATWNQYGAGMRVIEDDELSSLTGSRLYRSGVLTPSGGAVQPLSLARGLARRARELGVTIFGRSPVSALQRDGDGWQLVSAGGRVRAAWVVLATNGYTDQLQPRLAQSILPLLPIQIATEPLPETQIASILPQGHTISDTRRVIMYARREPAGRMVFGGLGKATADGGIGGHDWLVRDAERVFPGLRGVNWRYRWGGRIALTGDHLPHLHEPRKGVIAGLGYNGRGVAMAHAMGLCLARRVIGESPENLPFPTTAIRSIPARGLQMMGKGPAIGLMRLLDRLESA